MTLLSELVTSAALNVILLGIDSFHQLENDLKLLRLKAERSETNPAIFCWEDMLWLQRKYNSSH